MCRYRTRGQDDIKDGGEHADLAIHKWYPDPGWRVIPNTVKVKRPLDWSQGEEGVEKDWWFSTRNPSTVNEAVVCANTEHHGLGTSGKIHFRIMFTEERDVTKLVSSTRDVAIGWGRTG